MYKVDVHSARDEHNVFYESNERIIFLNPASIILRRRCEQKKKRNEKEEKKNLVEFIFSLKYILCDGIDRKMCRNRRIRFRRRRGGGGGGKEFTIKLGLV